jgi:hypothetical protein
VPLLKIFSFSLFFCVSRSLCFYRFVEWEDFADHAMVHNPKGGTAVLPKMITEKAKVEHVKKNDSYK